MVLGGRVSENRPICAARWSARTQEDGRRVASVAAESSPLPAFLSLKHLSGALLILEGDDLGALLDSPTTGRNRGASRESSSPIDCGMGKQREVVAGPLRLGRTCRFARLGYGVRSPVKGPVSVVDARFPPPRAVVLPFVRLGSVTTGTNGSGEGTQKSRRKRLSRQREVLAEAEFLWSFAAIQYHMLPVTPSLALSNDFHFRLFCTRSSIG